MFFRSKINKKTGATEDELINYDIEEEVINYDIKEAGSSFTDNTDSSEKNYELDNSCTQYVKVNDLISYPTLAETFEETFDFNQPKDIQKKMFNETEEGQEERLVILQQIKSHEQPENQVQIFFKSIAATVMTFPPQLMVEAKMKVFNLVTELELKALSENNSN